MKRTVSEGWYILWYIIIDENTETINEEAYTLHST